MEPARCRRTQVTLVPADFFVGGLFPALGPLAGRIEAQIGPDSFGVFGKVTWMFGAGGPTLIQMLEKNFVNNAAR